MHYDVPGVAFERLDATGPSVVGVRTDVAGFVGIAERGPVGTPIPLESVRQFEGHFGGPTTSGYLAYCVRAFFANGGRRCWAVRVVGQDASPSMLPGVGDPAPVLRDSGGRPVWVVRASSPGVFGDGLAVELRRTRRYAAVSTPDASTPMASVVDSVNGFERGSLVEITQPGPGGLTTIRRIVSSVDVAASTLVWVHPDAGARLPSDRPLDGLDRNRAIFIDSVEYDLLVFDRGRYVGTWTDLSLVPTMRRYGPRVLGQTTFPTRLEQSRGVPSPIPPIIIEPAEALSDESFIPAPLILPVGRRALVGGRDGTSTLTVRDYTGEPVSPLEDDATIADGLRGIEALGLVDEVAVVAIPDLLIRGIAEPAVASVTRVVDPCVECPPPPEPVAEPPRPHRTERPRVMTDAEVLEVQTALVDHCERRGDRFAILEVPLDKALDDDGAVSAVRRWRRLFDSAYAGLYYPWVDVVDPLGITPTRRIPPSGHVAGLIARGDRAAGVHVAPANGELVWAQGLSIHLDDAPHGLLNRDGINLVRAYPGRGLRIMGARTVSSDPDWRYVNVRRLLMAIRKTVDRALQWVVFEPNTPSTWLRVRLLLDSYLRRLFVAGALAGDRPEQSYYVKCDDETNPPEQWGRGRLVCEVGVAPASPFEFVVVRIGREGNRLETTEV